MRRRVWLMMAVALIAAVMAAPAAASAPDGFEEPITIIFPDLEYELAVLVNIDRAAYCTDEVVAFEEALIEWLEGGMAGPPPPVPESPVSFEDVPVQAQERGAGRARGARRRRRSGDRALVPRLFGETAVRGAVHGYR